MSRRTTKRRPEPTPEELEVRRRRDERVAARRATEQAALARAARLHSLSGGLSAGEVIDALSAYDRSLPVVILADPWSDADPNLVGYVHNGDDRDDAVYIESR